MSTEEQKLRQEAIAAAQLPVSELLIEVDGLYVLVAVEGEAKLP